MTLQSQNEFAIPEETARVARAAYPKGKLYMKMRDALGTIYQDESFAHCVSYAMLRFSRSSQVECFPDLPLGRCQSRHGSYI